MRLERTFDGARLQRVIEHPDVLPHVALGDSKVNLSPYVEDPANVCLMNEHGGFLFIRIEPGIYEVHTQFLPAGRGPQVLELAREALRWMFDQPDCRAVQTMVHGVHRGARRLCEGCGFASAGHFKAKTREGHDVEIEAYYLTRAAWEATCLRH